MTMTLSYTCCCFMIIKKDCFYSSCELHPAVLPFDFPVQTLAPKAHASAQKSHNPSFKQTSSKSTGDIIVTLFFCSPRAVVMWLCQSNNNPGKWMNSMAVPLILSTTMVIPLGFMNMAHSVLPFGECFNAHQRRITAQKHNTLLHGSCSSVKTAVVLPLSKHSETASELPASPTRARIRNSSWSKVKWKFTMTFRLIHTHLTSFYSGCLRKAWYAKFAEVRGGRIKKKKKSNTSGSVLICALCTATGHTMLQLNMQGKV